MKIRKHNSLQKHKRADTVKWTITWIVLALMVAALVLGGLQLFSNHKPSDWFKKKEEMQTEDDMGNLVVTPEEEDEAEDEAEPVRRMALRVAPIAREDFGDYGLEAASIESAVTITATITPEYVTNPRIAWSLSFANASSEWATGKNVETYISLQESGKQVVVTCNEAFGEQIILTATPLSNRDLAKTCKFDYVARPENVVVGQDRPNSYGGGSSFSHHLEIKFGEAITNFRLGFNYGVGTVYGQIYVTSFSLSLSEGLKSGIGPYLEGPGYTVHSFVHTFYELDQDGGFSYTFGSPTECFLTTNSQANPSMTDAERKANFLRGFIEKAGASSYADGELSLSYQYQYNGEVVKNETIENSDVDFLTDGLEIVATDFSISTDFQAF